MKEQRKYGQKKTVWLNMDSLIWLALEISKEANNLFRNAVSASVTLTEIIPQYSTE